MITTTPDSLLYRPLDHSARGCESRTAVLRRAYDGGLADGRNQLLVCARAASMSGAVFGARNAAFRGKEWCREGGYPGTRTKLLISSRRVLDGFLRGAKTVVRLRIWLFLRENTSAVPSQPSPWRVRTIYFTDVPQVLPRVLTPLCIRFLFLWFFFCAGDLSRPRVCPPAANGAAKRHWG